MERENMTVEDVDPVVSICIANYNGEQILDACLDSVRTQILDDSFEIIVHDDASTDASLEILSQHPEVRIIQSETNVGFCEANNRMVAASRGEFVLLLNNDAALLPGALSAFLAESRGTPRPSILTAPQFDWLTGALVDRGCLLDLFMNPVPVEAEGHPNVAMTIGACMWVPRSLWDTLGGFPAWLESIAEDMYLCCAARQRGYEVRCLPVSGYRHMQGQSFGGNRAADGKLVTTYRRRRLSERNKTFLLLLFTPGAWFLPLLALHVVALTGEGIILSVIRRDRRLFQEVYLTAILSVWRERKSLLAHRSRLQKMRALDASHYYSAFTWRPRKFVLLSRYGLPRFR
ncbi:GT2 family glycosyltransferase [Luteibacter jiangsuensis]|uniref:GT2 family glycosyltransferase n=1 Tax=Luteibacter jiangsuensis TaxID=637577 RepID=A0ABT9SYT5_9GAMM|nr:glycosyltransferase [Luteibacter jiangsuensis]MDQ0010171.1 GT2 family glycosyltransferase [Luteibacter jiangsuensis]